MRMATIRRRSWRDLQLRIRLSAYSNGAGVLSYYGGSFEVKTHVVK